ncbi:hypothetical protein BKA70DRAFT_1565659 [Coprinopsis sp. MPI-PUGE-AT-0042]|nr:hypothetical protein BKA70DRAFT_1565659 [Coprinopsis sp. MPI-PUGE-AT-0042]
MELPSLLVEYNSQLFRLSRRENYDHLIQTIRFHFASIKADDAIQLQTNDLSTCNGQWVDISGPIWPFVQSSLQRLRVTVEPTRQTNRGATDALMIHVELQDHGRTIPVRVQRSATVAQLLQMIQDQTGVAVTQNHRVSLNGVTMPPGQLMIARGLSVNATLVVARSVATLQLAQVPGPQIPGNIGPIRSFHVRIQPLDPTRPSFPVELESSSTIDNLKSRIQDMEGIPQTNNEWEFSAIYPVVPAKAEKAGGQTLTWTVTTLPDGSLRETQTGMDVSYLYWEADTTAVSVWSPPPSPLASESGHTIETFIPNRPSLHDLNSILVPLHELTPYLDKALLAMGPHTEARTSFITYWLPSFNKHKNIVLRFLPQEAYEKAAPLDVQPKPDVVARIFMLFQGVEDADLEHWRGAVQKAEEPAEVWANVVGIDKACVLDPSSFRVIEWGGMEVRG